MRQLISKNADKKEKAKSARKPATKSAKSKSTSARKTPARRPKKSLSIKLALAASVAGILVGLPAAGGYYLWSQGVVQEKLELLDVAVEKTTMKAIDINGDIIEEINVEKR